MGEKDLSAYNGTQSCKSGAMRGIEVGIWHGGSLRKYSMRKITLYRNRLLCKS